jgi:hypothetical protein
VSGFFNKLLDIEPTQSKPDDEPLFSFQVRHPNLKFVKYSDTRPRPIKSPPLFRWSHFISLVISIITLFLLLLSLPSDQLQDFSVNKLVEATKDNSAIEKLVQEHRGALSESNEKKITQENDPITKILIIAEDQFKELGIRVGLIVSLLFFGSVFFSYATLPLVKYLFSLVISRVYRWIERRL